MTRIVHCPGCKVLLVEPPAGTPIYQCGQCSMVLYAKHAIQSDVVNHVPAAAAAAQPQGPLYHKRSTANQEVATTSDKNQPLYQPTTQNKPLYSPRATLLDDMRKLARDAFSASGNRTSSGGSGGDEHDSQHVEAKNNRSITPPPQWKDIGVVDKQDSSEPKTPLLVDDHDHDHEDDFTFSKPREHIALKPSSLLSDADDKACNNNGGHEDGSKTSADITKATTASPPPPNKQLLATPRAYPRLDSPYVLCQHCKRLLEVPRSLPPYKKNIQKLRCGACHKISRFTVGHSEARSNADFSFSSTTSSPDSRGRAAARGGSSMSLPATSNGKAASRVSLDFAFENSPSTSSAPASFHHGGRSKEGKGYDSAPEFLSKASALSKHARTDSASSFPTAPCLHELFGYESPSQFVNRVERHHRLTSDKSKGIKGFFKSRMQSNGGVVINGKTIPEELVRKAEIQAGPVHHGSYWYDVRAGFWGVMGGPCLGIIPPCIEEFNHPMPVHCAGGRTGILVNGRELHHKDLEKLVQRGFPSTPSMSYTIDIDGVVIDLASESEIKCLGRLAPTLESRKAGFGMFPLSHA